MHDEQNKNFERTKTKKEVAQQNSEVKKTLSAIFTENTDDLTTISHGSRWKRRIVIALFFLASVFVSLSIISFWIFKTGPAFSGDNVQLEITGIDKIKSGQEIEYVLNYANLEQVPFRKAEVSVRYPAGFIFLSSDPVSNNEENNQWSLGAVAAGDTGNIIIKGVIIGEIETTKTITATMDYWPSNFSSEFQQVASMTTSVTDATLDVIVEGPEQILVGEKAEYVIRYKNYSERELRNVIFRLHPPDEFSIESIDPEIDLLNNTLALDVVPAEEEKKITVVGFFTTQAQGKQDFLVDSEIRVDEGTYKQRNYSLSTNVIKGDLALSLVVNGSYEDATVDFGNVLHYSIRYKNVSGQELSDVKMTIPLQSIQKENTTDHISFFNFDSLTATSEPTHQIKDTVENTLREDLLSWDFETYLPFKKLEIDQEGTVEFQVALKDKNMLEKELARLDHLQIASKVIIEIGKIGEIESPARVLSNNIVNAFNTDTSFDSFAQYFDAEGYPIGSGPIPPKVGQTTSYLVTWHIANSIHAVDTIVVSAVLPTYIKWGGMREATAGDISYNQETRTISWKINRMPLTVNQLDVTFMINALPEKEHVGKTILLLPRTTLSAIDHETAGTIIRTNNGITSGTLRDDLATDKGVVQDSATVNFDNAAGGNIQDIFNDFR